MSDSTKNIASPTPDEKDYDGPVSKEDYEKLPESNTGATVERDVDKPDPKSDQPAPLTKEEKENARKKKEIFDAELNQPEGASIVLPPEVPVPDDAREKAEEAALTDEREADQIAHGNKVTEKQRKKLESNTPPSENKK